MSKVKPGVYREPTHGHTIELFDDAEYVPPGYEFVATSKAFADGDAPAFVPPHKRAEATEAGKARKAPGENKARAATEDK